MKCKKMLCTLPMVMMLSTPVVVSPITALAAETTSNNTVSQVNSVKGYLFKNGITTPVYENTKLFKTDQSGPVSPEFPTLPENPLDGVPKEGTTITEVGSIGDVVYFDNDMDSEDSVDNSEKGHLPNGKVGKQCSLKTPEGVIAGFYDPDTFKIYPAPHIKLAQAGKNIFDGTTKVQRETKYELIDSAITDSVVGYQYSKSVMSGLSKADALSLTATLGFSYSVTEGGGVLPASATQEISGSLSGTYGHTITVNSSDTRTHSFTVDKVNNPSYPYNKYMTAAYQLRSTYTLIPGDGLQNVLNNGYSKLANNVYKYSEDQLYFGVTPGSHL
ncbi:hypothetical protein [Bacillus wiedmannii]|uniref:hypothetical protein n=1 Tax=Bacillus wiedmannii TaxID=1890302 RepID=UPI000BED09A0|nr:hypothetical protein [Bacillus wiedmannii]PEF33440.1 hypothetical protein CON72_25050 [Bacillus wiedmannii]